MIDICGQSVTLLFIRALLRRLDSFKKKILGIYRFSYLYMMFNGLKDKMKACLGESFLGRVTEIKQKNKLDVFSESKFVSRIITLCNSYKRLKIINLNMSFSVKVLNESKKEFYLYPLRSSCIFLTIFIVANLLFYFLLGKTIGVLGWVVRLSFLFLGISGLFSNADWYSLKKGSIIYKVWSKKYFKCV